ncbi:hypothetical protein WIN67_10565 [Pseudomonas idahonensis]|uniref:hypothetical protein n=1 Tax=Pseudomonas idahonensis TaxID=2942628 RepID=UPI0030D4031D
MERKELHRKVMLFKTKLEEGKIHVAEHLVEEVKRSFENISLLADGMVDPDSVDAIVRGALGAVAHIEDREEWKELISLKEIQNAYFNRVDAHFGKLFELMNKADANPYKFAAWFASDANRVDDNIELIDEFTAEIVKFWKNIAEPTWIHVEDCIDSKAIFTGELFPDGRSNLASSTGIYFDTTILPDPFLKIYSLFEFMPKQERLQEIIRLALQVLQYKDLALAEVEKPIIAVLPDRHRLDKSYEHYVNICAEQDTLSYGNSIFGTNYSDIKEMLEYLRSFKDSQAVAALVKDPKKMLFSTEWDGDFSTHIERYIEEQGKRLGFNAPGEAIFMNMLTRFSQANNSFQRSMSLGGTPVIRAETSWAWFNFMLGENAKSFDDGDLKNLHISRALQSTIKNEISWLGSVPIDALIQIRKTDALDEIRNILGSGLSEIIDSRPDNFFRTGDRVLENLQGAFREHEKKIAQLRAKKWKFAGLDIGSFIVVGGIEIAAAITGTPTCGVIATAANLTGLIPSAKDIKEKFQTIKNENTNINNTGVGILFNTKK